MLLTWQNEVEYEMCAHDRRTDPVLQPLQVCQLGHSAFHPSEVDK